MMPYYKHIHAVGDRHGKMVIKEIINPSRFVIECDCGNVREIQGVYFDKNKSCGCSQRSRRTEKGEPATNALFYTYNFHAKRRGLSFQLTKEEFKKLIKSNCYYCGVEPSQILVRGNDSLVYNGIDRLESNVGYTMDNVIPCCKMCNYMKRDYSYQTFMSQIYKIYKHVDFNIGINNEKTIEKTNENKKTY
jgi:hypothetical protein